MRRRGPAALVLAVVVAACSMLVGCSSDHGASLLGDRSAITRADAQQALDRRAAAIREGDLRAFLRTIDTDDKALVRRQQRYFANLHELPLASLSYEVLKSDWPNGLRDPRWSGQVALPQVRVSLQLRDFDSIPVERVTGFALARKHGRVVVISELTGAGKPFPGSNPAPWDLVRIHVRRDDETLQLYDATTWSQAREVSAQLRAGISSIRSAIPFAWDGRVVVYVFGRRVVLDSFEGVPGGNIAHLGAMTFPMYAVPGQPAMAGIRFTLLPSSLRAGSVFLGRIIRHELTHVALGEHDDGAPVWFAEGIAEYMGARDIPQDERRIATVALTRARQHVAGLPPSRGFNGADQAWHYALAWMACDYIAATYGEDHLWSLVDAFHDAGAGTDDAHQDAVLETVLGLNSRQLARRAAARILSIYG